MYTQIQIQQAMKCYGYVQQLKPKQQSHIGKRNLQRVLSRCLRSKRRVLADGVYWKFPFPRSNLDDANST